MLCPYCTHEIKDDTNFCTKCGHKIMRCPTCNEVLTTRDKYCINDGTPIPDEMLQDLPDSSQVDYNKEDPKPHFCRQCGKPCMAGYDLCDDCRKKGKSRKPAIILIIVLILLLLAGIAFGVSIFTGILPFNSSSASDSTDTPSHDEKDEDIPKEENSDLDQKNVESNVGQQEEDIEAPKDKINTGLNINIDTTNAAKNAIEYNDHKYCLYEIDKISWEDAEAYCENMGGHLVTITSQKE